MGKWEEYKLSEVVEFSGGSQPPKSTFSKEKKNGFIRLIQIRDYKSDNYIVYVEKSKAKKFCSVDDVMIGRYGPPVFQILKGIEGAYNVALMKAIPNESLLRKDYLFKFLDNPSIQSYIVGLSQRSAGQSGVNKKALEDYPILVPPLPEQKRIVSKLDGLFEKIDAAVVLLEENIAHTQALMGSVLDEIYSDGDIMIKDVCIVGPKKSEVKDLDDKLEVSFLPMRDLNEHEINFKPIEIKKLKDVYKGYTYFADGDIILAKVTPCFENGKAGLAKGLLNGIGFGSSEYHILRPKENVLPEWIYFAVLTEQFRVTGKENMTGAGGLKRVPRPFLEEWKIPVPELSIQRNQIKRIVQIQEETKKLNYSVTQKLEELKQLKSSLLDQAFKGEL